MRRSVLGAGVIAVSLLCSGRLIGQTSRFAGRWENVNPNGNLTVLEVTANGPRVAVQAWGRCQPSDCDWGLRPAVAYAPAGGSDVSRGATAILVDFRDDIAERHMVLRPLGNGLRVEQYTRFTGSGDRRPPYTLTETFRPAPVRPRALRAIDVRPQPALRESCSAFRAANLQLRRIGASWTIADGLRPLFAFGGDRAAAQHALATIQHYGLDRTCYAGGPSRDFVYLLAGGQAPVGPFPGEDCIAFDPATLQVQQIGGRWKIVNRGKYLYDFQDRQTEAEDALALIRKYGFAQQCFVGRPNAPFQYLRR